ncbi:MAG: alpha-glucosidase [Arenicella sp.]|jgi:alpha-glucosidase
MSHGQHHEFYPGKTVSHKQEDNLITFRCDNQTALQLYVLSDEIIRFRYSPDGVFRKDFSYAIDDKFEGKLNSLKVVEDVGFIEIQTEKVDCKIYNEGLRVVVSDKAGNILMEDNDKGFHWEENKQHGGYIVQMSKKIHNQENFFGLGDKSSRLNLRGKRFQNWSTDAFGYGPQTDPLYKNIPFYYSLHNHGHCGVFFDNTFRTFFDFGHENSHVCSFWANGGEMDYYFFYGETMLNVGENYTKLTGVPELPPLWALGFHQCKWSYYPESEVKRITKRFRDEQIPCDCIYLDIDYMEDYKCFTWDKEKFPRPAKMLKELAEDGFKTIVMIDPGIKIDPEYSVYNEGVENDYFVKRQDGDLLKGEVWPGQCHFPDYTKPEVREWWADLYKDLLRKDGVAGFWNDMNEPAVFDRDEKTIYLDARHDYDGNPCSHRKAHNIYGMQMARASFEGIKAHVYPKRPFLITRAIYSGAQRYALGWTGDNQATWEHLRIANTQCQRLSVSGMSFIGTDIGGFDGIPSGELFTRWIQLGIFHPFFRVHSMGDNLTGSGAIDKKAVEENRKDGTKASDQEPWSFGEAYTPIIKAFIELRYQLLPYIYTSFWQYTTYGTPMLRSLAFLESENSNTYYREDEFTLGDNVLVCPVLFPGATIRKVFLPKGEWINYWTGEKATGSQEIIVQCPLDKIPMFVRQGTILPFAPVMQYVGEKPIEQLTLHVYHSDAEHTSYLYEDAGEGYEYTKGKKNLKTFAVSNEQDCFQIQQTKDGEFQQTYQTYQLVLHGFPEVESIRIDGVKLTKKLTGNTFEAHEGFKGITIKTKHVEKIEEKEMLII